MRQSPYSRLPFAQEPSQSSRSTHCTSVISPRSVVHQLPGSHSSSSMFPSMLSRPSMSANPSPHFSTLHEAEQPSPVMVLRSSHFSSSLFPRILSFPSLSRFPSPQPTDDDEDDCDDEDEDLGDETDDEEPGEETDEEPGEDPPPEDAEDSGQYPSRKSGHLFSSGEQVPNPKKNSPKVQLPRPVHSSASQKLNSPAPQRPHASQSRGRQPLRQ